VRSPSQAHMLNSDFLILPVYRYIYIYTYVGGLNVYVYIWVYNISSLSIRQIPHLQINKESREMQTQTLVPS